MLFSSKSNRVVGIDIGTSSIKVVELEQGRGGKKMQLSNYAYFYNQEQDSPYYNAFNVQYTDIVDVLRKIFKGAGIVEKKVFVSIPLPLSFFTMFSLPKMKASEIEKSIQFEAKKFIPIPIDEVHFDWSIVKHMSRNNEQKILMVAVPNDIILKYYTIIKSLGLNLQGIETESFSLSRSLIGEYKDATMILDIGTRITNILIVEQKLVGVHYHSSVSLMRINESLAKRMSISYERAYKILTEQGLQQSDNIKSTIESILSELVLEMKKTNEEYISQGGNGINRVVLSSDGVKIPGIIPYVQSSLNVDVQAVNAFKSNSIKTPINLKSSPQVDLSVAIGLAMKEI